MKVDGQRETVDMTVLPDHLNDASAGIINILAHFSIPASGQLRIDGTAITSALQLADGETARNLQKLGWNPVQPSNPLSAAERFYYLRSTPLVRVNQPTVKEARSMLDSFPAGRVPPDDPPQLASIRKLFMSLTSTDYSYTWPPSAQGSEAMSSLRAGDCGGYSFLLAAWCRALDIPARVVVGTWAYGKSEAHVWNEVFLEGLGWIPVDASVAALILRDPHQLERVIDSPEGFAVHSKSESYVGGVDRGRLAFSLEADAHPLPGFSGWPTPPGDAPGPVLAHQRVRWGYELPEGNVPYLQPAYPLFHGEIGRADDSVLVGAWRFQARASRSALEVSSAISLLVGLAALVFRIQGKEGTDTELFVQIGLAGLAAFAAFRAALGHNRAVNIVLAAVLALALLLRFFS